MSRALSSGELRVRPGDSACAPGVFRIGLVGVGPKGLYCLERLAVELWASRPALRLEIHLFEPRLPGAGPVYDPSQPDFLRMNFAARHIDLWSPAPAFLPVATPSLVEWLAEHHASWARPDAYVPRRLVGEYLHAGYRSIVGVLQQLAEVTLHRRLVHSVERNGSRWLVETGSGVIPVDEVMIATGHDSRSAEPCDHRGLPSFVPAVYPVESRLDERSVPAGTKVALRGFGLTAIDAMLALTEGRGGSFERVAGEAVHTVSRLEYRPSGREVAVILPYSRTGRPMVPKPDGVVEAPSMQAIRRRGLREIAAMDARNGAVDRLLSVLAETANEAMEVTAPNHRANGESIHQRLETMTLEPESRLEGAGSSSDPLGDLERAVEVGFGERPPGQDWALGEAWRSLYPGLVELVSRGALDDEWRRFSALCREMERIAFGPSAENAAKVLALVRAGMVDLETVASPKVEARKAGFDLFAGASRRRADFVVDAVLAPAGAALRPSALIAGLLDRGHAFVSARHGGIEVAGDGSCLGGGASGLSVVGRPTEGSVLGNDTLSRSMHSIPERWAERIVRRLNRSTRTAGLPPRLETLPGDTLPGDTSSVTTQLECVS